MPSVRWCILRQGWDHTEVCLTPGSAGHTRGGYIQWDEAGLRQQQVSKNFCIIVLRTFDFVLNKDKGWKTQMCRQIFVKCIDQSEDRVMTSTSQVFKDWVMDCKVQICILHNSITVNVSCGSTFLFWRFLQFASIHFFLERSKKFTLKMCILAEWRI